VQVSDNQALHDPRFREAFAVGFVRGVARFLAPGSDAPPARPTGVRVENVNGGLRVSWDAVAGADGYRVLRADLASTRGRAFDEGTIVSGATELTVDASSGASFAFRVVAGNENGEGYASQAVVARVGAGGVGNVLVVSAYDRKDAFVQSADNDDMAAIEHGIALADALDGTGAGVDGALDEAIEAGAVSLSAYELVDIVVGKDSTEHVPLSAAMQEAITAQLDDGGAVIVSGEEIGYAMIDVAAVDESEYFATTFGATYVGDDAETFDLVGEGIFASVTGQASIDDGSALYEVVFPDIWAADTAARPDATAPLTYPDGTGAAIVTDNTALFGVGLEAVVDDAARAALFRALLEHLAPEVLDIAGEGEGEGEPGEGEGEAGEGEGEPGEGEGEGGEGEGEIDFDRASILPPPSSGCGCTSTSSPSDAALALLALCAVATTKRRSA
jgi:MYXO-CTERM domain-containing protein